MLVASVKTGRRSVGAVFSKPPRNGRVNIIA